MLAPNNNYSGLKLIPKVDVEVACRWRSHRPWNHSWRASSPRPYQSSFNPEPLFWVTNMSNRTGIKYPGTTMSISKVHINNMYIKYTFVHFAILLIRQILGAVSLWVTSPFAVEALSFRFGSRLGLLPGSGNLLAILLEVPLLSFAVFLKLVVPPQLRALRRARR